MKKIIYIVLVLFFITTGAVFSEESDYYYKTVRIVKAYIHSQGYRLVYLKSDLSGAAIHIPLTWITSAERKAEIVFGDDPAYPYFSVFWKNGVFSHVRVYLKKSFNDLSWGELDDSLDLSGKFDIDSLSLQF